MEQDFVQAKVKLEVHRAVAAERHKWEEEQRQLEEEWRQWSVVSSPVVAPSNNDSELLRPNEPRAVGNAINTAGIRRGMGSPVSTMNVSTTDTVSSVHSLTTPGTGGQATNSVPQLQAHPFPCNIFESMAIPPLRKFSGESESEAGKLFMDWIEQVASVCHWDDRAKLVNLTTRLRGQAFAFYRSCSTQQWNNYTILVSELKKRFTPVRLQAVQSSLFHDRKQKSNENVDAYAQELRTLFYRAYPQAQQGTQETEQMARTMLANQFAVGLRQDIKVKVARVEGTFKQLLTKANSRKQSLETLVQAVQLCYLLRGNPVYLEMKEQSRALTPSTKRGAIIAMQPDIFPEIVQYVDVLYLQNPMGGVIITRVPETLGLRK